jgi:PhnB protein
MSNLSSTHIHPFLTVQSGKDAIEFYKRAFNATETERFEKPDGKVTAKITVDKAEFYVGDEEPEFGNFSPLAIGGSPVRMIFTCHNPEEVFANALSQGATQICPVTTEEDWKIGKLKDPFGHIWEIGCPLL